MILYALGSRCSSKANAALRLESKAPASECSKEEVQRRESFAREHSSRLLDVFENNTDQNADRDGNLRASRTFEENAFNGTFIGSEDFDSERNVLDPADSVVVEEQGDVIGNDVTDA
jgi:hypothetical protein